jgi:WD40 repeat protein
LYDAAKLAVPETEPESYDFRHGHHSIVCFSQDGRFLFSSAERKLGMIPCWPRFVPAVHRHFQDASRASAHEGKVSGLDCSADSFLLVSTCKEEGRVKLWDVPTGRMLSTFVPGPEGVSAAFCPDGRHLAVAGDQETLLYEVLLPTELTPMAHLYWPLHAFAIAPDGRTVACVSDVRYQQEYYRDCVEYLSTWDLTGGQLHGEACEPWPKGQDFPSRSCVAFHPGGKVAVLQPYPGGWGIWDETRKQCRVGGREPKLTCLCFSRDGRTLWGALPDGNLAALSWPDLETVRTWTSRDMYPTTGSGGIICLTAGERWVAVGTRDPATKLVRQDDATLVRQLPSPGGLVQSVAFSPDDALLLSGTQTGVVQVIRLPDGEPIGKLTGHRGAVEAIAFSPTEPLLVTGSNDHTVRLWRREGESFHEVLTFTATGAVSAASFTPGGRKLVWLVDGEPVVRVWDLDRLRRRLEQMGLGW